MSALLFGLLWLANRCWWIVYRQNPDITHMRVTVELFVGEPDEMGSYPVTTLTTGYGPKI